MRSKSSLRRIVVTGSVISAATIALALLGLLLMLGTMRTNLAKNTETLIAQQRAAEDILAEVYAQVLSAYAQIDRPQDEQISEFWKHGRRAYRLIQQYLAAPLPRDARLQVERIKELHQQLEVEAQQLFDLIRTGDSERARLRAGQLRLYGNELNAAVLEFLSIQSRQRDVLEASQAATFRRLTIISAIVAFLILAGGLAFAGVLRRHIVVPLENLASAAEAVGAGNLSVRLPSQQTPEFASVAESFNKMAEALEEERRNVGERNAQLENALKTLHDTQGDLVRQEKLSGLGQMLAGLAHELNNPMGGILGMSENLALELAELPGPEAAEMNETLVRPLVKEAKRARDLVRNLLSFSRAPEMSLGTANVSDAIAVAVGLREGAFRSDGKKLEVDVPPDILVRGESQRLQQVFINLMNNALDALNQGQGTFLRITAVESGNDIEIVFRDDGPGFADPQRAFDPFYTTKLAGMGTGLGLSLVLQFVTEFGGTVTASNAPEGGARIVIRLSRVLGSSYSVEEDRPQPEIPMQSPNMIRGMRFLVVDDEAALLSVQRRVLLRAGAYVDTAPSAEAARAKLSQSQYDFIVSDIRMPGAADGIALIAWIAHARPGMLSRVLLVTGDMSVTDELLTTHLNTEQFLVKPFTITEYLDRLNLLLSRA